MLEIFIGSKVDNFKTAVFTVKLTFFAPGMPAEFLVIFSRVISEKKTIEINYWNDEMNGPLQPLLLFSFVLRF